MNTPLLRTLPELNAAEYGRLKSDLLQGGYWTRIGSVWPHADGKGFNIQLEVVPLDGRITIRIATEKKE